MTRQIEIRSARVADELHSIAIHLLRSLRKLDESSGLTPSRLSALSVIVFSSSITLRELAAMEQVKPPTMTRIVQALEERKLIVREENEEDGRSIRLSATTSGKKLLLEGRKRRIQSLNRRIESLGKAQQETLLRAAQILTHIVREP